MKVLIITLLATLGLQAGMLSTVQGFGMKDVDPKAAYTLETNGYNPRVYEFIPLNDKKTLCVVVFANSDKGSAPALQCFKK